MLISAPLPTLLIGAASPQGRRVTGAVWATAVTLGVRVLQRPRGHRRLLTGDTGALPKGLLDPNAIAVSSYFFLSFAVSGWLLLGYFNG